MSLQGKKVVLTGKFESMTRKVAGNVLKDKGATVSGSVSGKTDFLVAGSDSGAKLYKAFEYGIPILGEPHLQMLLNGSDCDDVIDLAGTFYSLELLEQAPTKDHLSYIGGLPPGVFKGRWPRNSDGITYMDHLFTLDLHAMPALQLYFPEHRTLSLFAKNGVDMYEASDPFNGMTSLVLSTQEQVDEANLQPPRGKSNKIYRWLQPIAHQRNELNDHFGDTRVLGSVPCWCQSEQHQGLFLMQFGESFGIPGDGLVYMFDDTTFAQFT